MPSRGRFFRFGERASYKASDVVVLFLIGVFLGMSFVGLSYLINYVVQVVFYHGKWT